MPNLRALGRRLSCLVAGLFDGSPLPAMLEESGFEVVHSAAPQETLRALDANHWQVVLLSDSLGDARLAVGDRTLGPAPPAHARRRRRQLERAGGRATRPCAWGAADFVAPPFDRESLDARLRRLNPRCAHPPGAGPPDHPRHRDALGRRAHPHLGASTPRPHEGRCREVARDGPADALHQDRQVPACRRVASRTDPGPAGASPPARSRRQRAKSPARPGTCADGSPVPESAPKWSRIVARETSRQGPSIDVNP